MSLNKKYYFKDFIKPLSAVLVSIFFVYFIYSHTQDFKKIFEIKISDFIILSILFFLAISARTFLLKDILVTLKIKINFFECICLSFVRGCLDLIFFRGGAIVVATHLKKYHDFYYSSSLVTMVLSNLLQILWSCVGLIVGGLFILFQSSDSNFLFFWPIIFFTILFISLFYLPKKVYFFIPKRFVWVNSVVHEWVSVRKNYKLVLRLSVWFCASLLITSFNTFLIFKFAYKEIPLSVALFITSIGSLSLVFTLTPSALGIREGLMGLAGSIIGLQLGVTVAAALLQRIINILWLSLIGFPIFFSLYSKNMLKR